MGFGGVLFGWLGGFFLVLVGLVGLFVCFFKRKKKKVLLLACQRGKLLGTDPSFSALPPDVRHEQGKLMT